MIFSILSTDIIDATVIDIFCGTGAFGIEAISRGAKSVAFIDRNVDSLKANINLISDKEYTITKKDFLKLNEKSSVVYDIVFIDPPYGVYSSKSILDVVYERILLTDNSTIIYEEFYKTDFPSHDLFNIYDERRAGDTTLRFLNKKI